MLCLWSDGSHFPRLQSLQTRCKMGFGPPEELTDPDETDRHFAAAFKLAPQQCFHCLGEGHMKPQCPLLKSDVSSQPKQNVPQGRTNEGQNQRASSQTSNQADMNALEQRIKKQTEEMEKRKLQAIGDLTAPRQNFGGQRSGQAKGASTDEKMQDDGVRQPEITSGSCQDLEASRQETA